MVFSTSDFPVAWFVVANGVGFQNNWNAVACLPVAANCHVNVKPVAGKYTGGASTSAAGGMVATVICRAAEGVMPMPSDATASSVLAPSASVALGKVKCPLASAL